MDYEKMYKEALERAKKFEEKYGGGYAEYIFPELAESEDERIRKELKEAFEAYDIESKWNGIPIRSIFAWLEKQKARPIPDKFSGLKSLMLQYSQSVVHRNDDAEIESDTDLWGRKILDYVWKYSDEQKEQKPDWSEEDEDMLNSCISSIEEAKENRYAYKETDGGTSYDHEIDWLKSLRPQYHGDVTMTEAYKMGLEAGKVSSWKPSEHQMTILKAVKDYVGKGSGYWGEGLGSLIDDLEKL